MNHYHAGLRALERQDYDQALRSFTRSLEIDRSDADALAYRSRAYASQGKLDLAEADVSAAIELSPRSPRAHFFLGLVEQARGRDTEAEKCFQQARACDEDGLLNELAPSPKPPAASPLVDGKEIRIDAGRVAKQVAIPLALPAVVDDARPNSLLEKLKQLRSGHRSGNPRTISSAGMTSAAIHGLVLTILGLLVVHGMQPATLPDLVATMGDSDSISDVTSLMPLVTGELDDPQAANSLLSHRAVQAATEVTVTLDPLAKDDPLPVNANVGLAALAMNSTGMQGMMQEIKLVEPSELETSRSEEARREAVRARGGTPESEAAVAKALDWIARHQNQDGSWSFDHQRCVHCQRQCGDPGSLVQARVGATAIALLPFLGAGHTHQVDRMGGKSSYHDTIDKGLSFLLKHMGRDGMLTEPGGRMYDHGLAATVLCEAYGMTHDRDLMAPAQLSMNYIFWTQDPVGGGWRYRPQQPGDTSVVAWQLMALKSGHLAYLQIPPIVPQRATLFLNYVSQDGGAGYGYTEAARGSDATTAAGLLCRMYLGWKRDEPALGKGVEYLSNIGPSKDDIYFNYYATQVMHHYDGPLWKKWNDTMRDQLVDTQVPEGHGAGSWYIADPHGIKLGGRLYATAMAAMTLEVYYRYMPLYNKPAVQGGLGR